MVEIEHGVFCLGDVSADAELLTRASAQTEGDESRKCRLDDMIACLLHLSCQCHDFCDVIMISRAKIVEKNDSTNFCRFYVAKIFAHVDVL